MMSIARINRWACFVAGLLALIAEAPAAEPPDYALADPDMEAVLIDSDAKESFLAVQADASGRLFVGGREALFVYEVDDKGGYRPRQELVRFPDHTWIYDVAIRGNDVYALTVSALYVIPDAVTNREGLKPKRLIWGHPLGHVHQCFHGMALGPEGDIYFAMGDPLWYYGDFERPDHWGHWTFFTQPEGTKTPYTGVGGVFRCRPDGSNLQVVARGLRNSCGLCFDRDFNLFTNDNDHEGLPAAYVPGRLIHVTPYSYFGWPRGWLVSKTPERADLLETMSDQLGRFVPVGQAYYDETFLPARLRNNLLVARWCTRMVANYPLEHRGASFKVDEKQLLIGQNDARPVGVGVGRGGRIFVTISYMAHNDGSPTYKSDLVMITRADDAPEHPFEGYIATEATPEKLWSELSKPSWERRYRAHTELLRRGGKLLDEAAQRLIAAKPGDPAVNHLIWLAGASGRTAARDAVLKAVKNENEVLRLQAIRVLTEYAILKAPREVFSEAIKDGDPRVQHAALLALFDQPAPLPDAVMTGPAISQDTYLRQAAMLLLAEKATLDELNKLCRSRDTATRLAGVLAAGFRLTLPPATAPIPEHLPLDKDFRGPVIEFAEKKVDLRELGRIGNFTTAEHWKAGRHTLQQRQLFEMLLARLDDDQESVRLQAAHFLELLNDPRSEPKVVKVRTASEDRRLAVAPLKLVDKIWFCGPFADGDKGYQTIHPPEKAAVDLSAKYEANAGLLVWNQASTERLHDFVKLLGPCDKASVYAYFRLESGVRQRINLLVGSDDGIKVWHNGQSVWANDTSRAALPFQDVLTLALEPGSNDILVRVRNLTGSSGLYAHYRSLAAAAHTLPDKVGVESLAQRLAGGAGAAPVPEEFLKIDWAAAVQQGNVEQGRKLYDALGCAKCHAVSTEAALTGGPSLADAAKRFTVPYLVESMLLPNKQISPVFRATSIVTKEGQQFSGLVVAETADKLEVLLPDTKRRTVAKSDIEQRELQNQSPMPQGVIKKTEELRDLLAYLLAPK